MAQSTVLTLIPQTSHASSNSINLIGDKKQAASYFKASSNIQTIIWNVGANIKGMAPSYFIGNIVIQASLSTTPGVFDWFDVFNVPIESNASGQSGYHNLIGNYVWVRVTVTNWVSGPIQSITMSY